MIPALRQARSSSITLLVFAIFATAILAVTYRATHAQIQSSQEAEKLLVLNQVLPAQYDNRPVTDVVLLEAQDAAQLGHDGPAKVFIARQQDRVTALAFEAVAPNGYGGKIRLLVGIGTDDKMIGVRVVGHKETPGLGDYIDAAHGPWSQQFAGQSFDKIADWTVKKDGGRFDFMAGATISPRAVTAAAGRVFAFYHQHRQRLIQTPRPE